MSWRRKQGKRVRRQERQARRLIKKSTKTEMFATTVIVNLEQLISGSTKTRIHNA